MLKKCVQQSPKNRNVRFSTDVEGEMSSMQRDRHARKHARQTAVVRSQSTTLTSDVDPGVVGWH